MSEGLPRLSRRSVRAPCQVVRERDFRLVGRHIVDLSTDGMLVLTDTPVLTGTSVICTLKMPFGSTKWLDAEAVVARVVHNRRPGDPGRAIGLAFTWVEPASRDLLEKQLAWFSPSRKAVRTYQAAASGEIP
jgi:hypothetical protein